MKTITTDVVVVGSSLGGLTAAIMARQSGLEVLVVETAEKIGGTTANSPGLLWIPDNEFQSPGSDSYAEARAYLETVLGDETTASTKERRDAFISTAPIVAKWLTLNGVALALDKGRPDFFPQGKRSGRTLRPRSVDRATIGPLAQYLPDNPITFDLNQISIRGPRSAFLALSELTNQTLYSWRNRAANGAALMARLLLLATTHGVSFWMSSTALELIDSCNIETKATEVTGVVVQHEGQQVTVTANRAVILASGGFEANQRLREDHLPLPTTNTWTLGNPLNQGFAVTAGKRIGAVVEAMDRAWWTPVMLCDGTAYELDQARCLPHSMLVDANGYRFLNEASPKPVFGRQMYDRARSHNAIPSYLIMDNQHRSRYRLGPWLPGATPATAIESGDIVKAGSINELAQKLGIDPAGLIGTVVRFNQGAHKQRDPDFHRGETPHERYLGDSRLKNPNLGKLTKPPFWGIRVYPGDTGTRGGLLVNADCQVLNEAREPITGLFACGGATASIMKNSGPATGAKMTAALVDGFRAAATILGKDVTEI